MSAPEPLAASTASSEPPAWTWSEEDAEALFQSAFWFDSNATEELLGRYRGMHVAIFGERIVDADRDFNALGRRLEMNHGTVPMNRIILRYVPTDEESLQFRY